MQLTKKHFPSGKRTNEHIQKTGLVIPSHHLPLLQHRAEKQSDTRRQSFFRSEAKEHLTDEPRDGFHEKDDLIPVSQREENSPKERVLWLKDMFPMHSGDGSLSVLFGWCVPACSEQNRTHYPNSSVQWASSNQKHGLTVLFVNLNKGFVWLLCSCKIVLVLKKINIVRFFMH